MAAEQQFVGGMSESTLDARLDAIDQILLGCIPRAERLAIIATVEEKLRSHCTAPADQVTQGRQLATSFGGSFTETMPYPAPARSRLRRSKLAVASGVLGLAGGALLFGTPVAYGLAAFSAELLDETFAIITLVAYAVLIVLASGAAILAGLVALWRLRRKKEVCGKGWALTGLCTGPIPLGLTALIGLYVGIQTIDLSSYFGSGAAASPVPASTTAGGATTDPYPYAFVPGGSPLPPAAIHVDPEAPLRLASESQTTPAPVELARPMPPACVEMRPDPVAQPEPDGPDTRPTESNSGLME